MADRSSPASTEKARLVECVDFVDDVVVVLAAAAADAGGLRSAGNNGVWRDGDNVSDDMSSKSSKPGDAYGCGRDGGGGMGGNGTRNSTDCGSFAAASLSAAALEEAIISAVTSPIER
jgi:hypothetical protein